MALHLDCSYYRNNDKAEKDGWKIIEGKLFPPEGHEAFKRVPEFYRRFRGGVLVPNYFIEYYPLEEEYQHECDYHTKVLKSYNLNKEKAKADGWYIGGENTFVRPPRGHKAVSWCASYIPNEVDGNAVPSYFIEFYPLE